MRIHNKKRTESQEYSELTENLSCDKHKLYYNGSYIIITTPPIGKIMDAFLNVSKYIFIEK